MQSTSSPHPSLSLARSPSVIPPLLRPVAPQADLLRRCTHENTSTNPSLSRMNKSCSARYWSIPAVSSTSRMIALPSTMNCFRSAISWARGCSMPRGRQAEGPRVAEPAPGRRQADPLPSSSHHCPLHAAAVPAPLNPLLLRPSPLNRSGSEWDPVRSRRGSVPALGKERGSGGEARREGTREWRTAGECC